MRKVLAAVIILSLGLFSGSCGTQENAGPGSRGESPGGVKRIYFRLKHLGTEDYTSLDDLAGKPVLIDFWATWCPPCRSAIPYVEKLDREYGEKVHVIGINLDSNPETARKFIQNKGEGYLQLEGYGTRTPSEYGVRGIPSFFVLDASGNIVKSYVGFSMNYYEEWKEVIDGLQE
ncbi:MAG: TlpA family protein disulfide reductase [Elusimicrobia bacterium]|nr:TlpA family protein disulfide reductase [Elusimicrobiota bacterium]